MRQKLAYCRGRMVGEGAFCVDWGVEPLRKEIVWFAVLWYIYCRRWISSWHCLGNSRGVAFTDRKGEGAKSCIFDQEKCKLGQYYKVISPISGGRGVYYFWKLGFIYFGIVCKHVYGFYIWVNWLYYAGTYTFLINVKCLSLENIPKWMSGCIS